MIEREHVGERLSDRIHIGPLHPVAELVLQHQHLSGPGPQLVQHLLAGPPAHRYPEAETPEDMLRANEEVLRCRALFRHRPAEDVILRERALVAERPGIGLLDLVGRLVRDGLLDDRLIETGNPPHQEPLGKLAIRTDRDRMEMRRAWEVPEHGTVTCEDVPAKVPAPEQRGVGTYQLDLERIVCDVQAELVRLLEDAGAFEPLQMPESGAEIEAVAPGEQRRDAATAEILPFIRSRDVEPFAQGADGILGPPLKRVGDHLHEHGRDDRPANGSDHPLEHLVRIALVPVLPQGALYPEPSLPVQILEGTSPSEGNGIPRYEDEIASVPLEHRRIRVDAPSLEPAETDEGHSVGFTGRAEDPLPRIDREKVVLVPVEPAEVLFVHGIATISVSYDKYV